jgi:hypothetical protein
MPALGYYALAVFIMACMNALAKYLAQWHHPIEMTFWRSFIAFAVVSAFV